MKKEVCIVFTGYPMGNNLISEKLRMAVGLTINDDIALTVLFLNNARFALHDVDEKAAGMGTLKRHIETLSQMKAKILVEEGGDFSIAENLTHHFVPAASVKEIIGNADVVIH